jgi:hypothetical protein
MRHHFHAMFIAFHQVAGHVIFRHQDHGQAAAHCVASRARHRIVDTTL